ncbi:MAG: hypothetical protein JRN20_03965 [Nitrososphaerota archaeon]|nr:hypothetical protein [Nitrososphaerota archaeon]
MNDALKENMVASVVDMSSIMFAYSLGMRNMNLLFGLGYALFDAWIVIWQRKRITRLMSGVNSRLRRVSTGKEYQPLTSSIYVGSVLWEN